jgi:hypothetical protein
MLCEEILSHLQELKLSGRLAVYGKGSQKVTTPIHGK